MPYCDIFGGIIHEIGTIYSTHWCCGMIGVSDARPNQVLLETSVLRIVYTGIIFSLTWFSVFHCERTNKFLLSPSTQIFPLYGFLSSYSFPRVSLDYCRENVTSN